MHMKKMIIFSLLFLSLTVFSKEYVMIMSDSTAVNYRSPNMKNYYKLPWAPMSGWGEFTQKDIRGDIPLLNRAAGGYSSKTYFESWFPHSRKALRKDGWLLLSFGSNDCRPHPTWDRVTKPESTYQEYLDKMASEAANAGMKIVIISPPPFFMMENGKFNNSTLEPYAKASKQLAERKGYYFIDLFNLLSNKFKNMTEAEIRTHYMFLKPGDSPNWPKGAADILHFQNKGSELIWQLMLDSIRKDIPDLAKLFK